MFCGASASTGPSSSSVVRSHEPAVALAVEVRDEVLALLLALGLPGLEQAVEVAGALVRQAVEVDLRLLVEHVEVADGAERAAGAAKPLEHRPQHLRIQVVGEHAQRHAHAARGDAHVVQFLGILAQPRALFVLEHLGEVEAERLGGRFGHRVRRLDVGPLLRRGRERPPSRPCPGRRPRRRRCPCPPRGTARASSGPCGRRGRPRGRPRPARGRGRAPAAPGRGARARPRPRRGPRGPCARRRSSGSRRPRRRRARGRA